MVKVAKCVTYNKVIIHFFLLQINFTFLGFLSIWYLPSPPPSPCPQHKKKKKLQLYLLMMAFFFWGLVLLFRWLAYLASLVKIILEKLVFHQFRYVITPFSDYIMISMSMLLGIFSLIALLLYFSMLFRCELRR